MEFRYVWCRQCLWFLFVGWFVSLCIKCSIVFFPLFIMSWHFEHCVSFCFLSHLDFWHYFSSHLLQFTVYFCCFCFGMRTFFLFFIVVFWLVFLTIHEWIVIFISDWMFFCFCCCYCAMFTCLKEKHVIVNSSQDGKHVFLHKCISDNIHFHICTYVIPIMRKNTHE